MIEETFWGASVIYRFVQCAVFWLLLAVPVHAAIIHPGLKTLGIWIPDTQIRLDLAIWYPASRVPVNLDYGDFVIRAARGAQPLPGPYPLLVLSHDNAGTRFSLHQLAAALTRYGFVVVAPTHLTSTLDNMDSLFGLEQLRGRCRQIASSIDVVLADEEIGPLIDPERIGVLGIGPGGTAALMLAGATLDAEGWANYCTVSEQNLRDPYCASWTASRMELLVSQPNLGDSFRDRRIRAAVAVAPHYGMLLTLKTLSRIRIPVLLVKADKEPMSRIVVNDSSLVKNFPIVPQYASLSGAGTAALMSSCSDTLAPVLPELCLSISDEVRETVQRQMSQLAGSFFNARLNLPTMPAPLPDYKEVVAPPPAAPAPPPVQSPRRSRRR